MFTLRPLSVVLRKRFSHALPAVIGAAVLVATTSLPANADSAPSSLAASRSLVIGTHLTSPDRRVGLLINARGALLLTEGGAVVWMSHTTTSRAVARGTQLRIGTRGRVILQRRSGTVVWRSRPAPGATRLVLTNGGDLRLVGPHISIRVAGGRANTAAPAAPSSSVAGSSVPEPSVTAASQLTSLQQLRAGEQLSSDDGHFHLLLQHDGNLVLVNAATVLWSSGEIAGGDATVVMQPDGNLVVHDSENRPRWATQTASPGAYLVLQNDGDLVLFSSTGSALWATKTAQ